MSQRLQITRSRRPSQQRGAHRKTFCGVTSSWRNKVSSFLIPKLPSGTAAYRHEPGKYDDYVADDPPISKSHHPVMNACARGHPRQVRWSQDDLSAGAELIFFEICQEKCSLFPQSQDVELWFSRNIKHPEVCWRSEEILLSKFWDMAEIGSNTDCFYTYIYIYLLQWDRQN